MGRRRDTSSQPAPGGGFGDLLKAKGLVDTGTADAAPETAVEGPDGPDLAGKVVVRRTRKGRGGKTVTLVQGAGGDLDVLAKQLRKGLGTGARVEDGEIVVQGDVVDRVVEKLEALGAGRVVRG